MKKLKNINFWLLTLLVPGYLYSQEAYVVQRGPRPAVILEDLPESSWVQGKVRIKFHPDLYSEISGTSLIADESGYVKTDNPALDRLNQTFGVARYNPLFDPLYKSNSSSIQYQERHKAWGFHLWFELDLDTKANIVEVVNEFLLLDEVLACEPEYKKHLVSEDPGMNSNSSQKQLANILSGGWLPNDPDFGNQWHFNNTGQHSGTPGADIDLQAAWQIEKGNPEIIVAIIDGGIDYTHNDLAANMWVGIGYNFVNNTSTILPHNHGTHIAGIVAASSNNGIGVAGIAGGSGLGDGVRLMSCQVFTNTGNGGFHIAPVYAADNGAAISQNSWGYTSPGVYEQLVLDAIDYFNLNGGGGAMDGGVSIFAAGNSNTTGQFYPACYEGAFSVTATNNMDQKAWYSNYDTWVDIAAPGGEISSLINTGVLSTVINNEYTYYQGTSMACPHVTGVAALVISNAYAQLQNDHLAEILRNSADEYL
jgi:subtilisin family serine protease